MSLFSITRTKGGVIAWTPDQVAYIIDKYVNENYTLKQLGKEFNCNYATIRNCLNKNNIASRGNKQGYPRNEYYFYNIDSAEKAYWLGFMYSDGTVASNNSEIAINITDKEHVEKFQKAIKAFNHKITIMKDNRFKNARPLYMFSIKDKQLHQDLIKWGCVPNKTLLINSIPNIPRNYISHFIRGYYDGDGGLHWLQGTNNYRICITCSNSEFLNDIQKELETKVSLEHQKDRHVYQLQISGRKQVERILNYLYKNSTEETRLDRKYNTYLKCLEWAHSH